MHDTTTKFAIIDRQGRTMYSNVTEHAICYLCMQGVVGYVIYNNQRNMRPRQKLVISTPISEWVSNNISAAAHLN